MLGIMRKELGFGRAGAVCAIVKTARTNPALLTIASWNPGPTFEALFTTARRAKLEALRGVLGGGWSRGSHGQSG